MEDRKKEQQKPIRRKTSLQNISVEEAQNQAQAQEAVEQLTSPVASPLKKSASTRSHNCLCSPTTHIGSFRCRLHRHGSNFRRGHSVGSDLSELANKYSSTKPTFHTSNASSLKLMP